MATRKTTLPPTRLIAAKKAAIELGIPYTALRDAHFRGELTVIKIGKNERHAAWYFERIELERWITAQTVKKGTT